MKNAFFFLAFFLFLLSFGYAIDLAKPVAFADKFVQVEITKDLKAWTHKDVNPDFLIASDAYWYGSSAGKVKIIVYLKTKLPDGYFIGMETMGKPILVKQVTEDKGLPAAQLTTADDKFIYNKLVPIAVDKEYKMTFDVEFDAKSMGVQEEFDIILYNDKMYEVARYDPYLSGYAYRIPFTLDTAGKLDTTVTNDHAIMFNFSPADDGNFWSKHPYLTQDYNGIAFTTSDGTTELDFTVEDWNAADKNAWFWVTYTDDFSASNDSNGYIYIAGGSDVNNDKGSAAFPTDYNAFYWLNSKSGTTLKDATGHTDGKIDPAGWMPSLVNDGSFNFAASKDANASVGSPTNQDFTLMGIVNTGTAAQADIFEFSGFRVYTRTTGDCSSPSHQVNFTDTLGNPLCSGGAVGLNGWHFIAATYSETDGNRTIWLDNNAASKTQDLTTATNNNLYISRYSDAVTSYWTGYIDSVLYLNRKLSNAEVRLQYLSLTDQLVSFGEVETAANGVVADFNYSSSGYLDQEGGINSVTLTLTDASIYVGTNPTAWKWLENGTQFSTDQNTTRIYSSGGDYNICFDVNAQLSIPPSTEYFDEDCATIPIPQSPQSMDIIATAADYNNVAVGVDFNSTAITSGVDAYYWLYDSIEIGRDENIFYQFSAPDQDANICIMMQFEDVNKIRCETFYVAKYTVKKPILQSDFVTLIVPFTITINTMPLQYDANNSIDENFFLFSGIDENYSVTVDVNSDYYQQKYNANTKAGYAIIQPYMVDKANGVEVTVYTIDNINNRISLPDVAVESYVSGLLVESVMSDGAGTALMHFQKGTTYTLKFYYGGTLKISQTYVPTGATNLFAYIDTGTIAGVTTVGAVRIEWVHSPTNEIPVNNIIKLYQIISPISTKIDDINLTISHDDNSLVYNAYITGLNTSADYNLSYDVNISGLSQFKPLKVRIQIWDVNGVLIKDETSHYTFVNSTAWTGLFQNIRTGLGEMLATMLSCFILLGVAKSIVRFRQGEDNNWVFVPIAGIAGMMVFLGLLTFVPFILALLFAASLSVWEMRQ